MIKHLALIAAGVLSLHTAAARKYVDASTLTLIGRTCPMEGNPYYRVDTARYHFDNATIRRYCGYPAWPCSSPPTAAPSRPAGPRPRAATAGT